MHPISYFEKSHVLILSMNLFVSLSLWSQATLNRTETPELAGSVTDSAMESTDARTIADEPPLKKWKLLAAKQARMVPTAGPIPNNDPQSEMNKYLIELRMCNSSPLRDSLAFWRERKCVFPCLSDTGLSDGSNALQK
jgi:hypothetical protein